MNNFNTETYEMKREIANFSKKLTKNSNKIQKKFTLDMLYGISKSKSVLLSSISDSLIEKTKRINTIDRLSVNLDKDLDPCINENYLKLAINELDEKPIIIVDDSDVVKPTANKFEDLGVVRDGSKSTKSKNVYEKGYHVTEMVGMTKNQKQPISLYSHIHSSMEKEYTSDNAETFKALDTVITALNRKAIFTFDRGYDFNNLFKYMENNEQDYVIRLTEKRNIFYHGKWYKSTTLRDSRKGKIKMNMWFQEEEKECYATHLKVQITASKKYINLVLVYGLGDVPMMLATSLNIFGKKDVINVVRTYMSRWRIEEYFKFKKQEYGFENFRVRGLRAINNLNKMLSYTLGIIAMLAEKLHKNNLVNKILKRANSLRDDVLLWGYQLSRGIYKILSYAKTGIRDWQNIRKTKVIDNQLYIKLPC